MAVGNPTLRANYEGLTRLHPMWRIPARSVLTWLIRSTGTVLVTNDSLWAIKDTMPRISAERYTGWPMRAHRYLRRH
jgi:hypothetical protein